MELSKKFVNNFIISAIIVLVLLLGAYEHIMMKLNQIDKDVKNSDNSQYVIEQLTQVIQGSR